MGIQGTLLSTSICSFSIMKIWKIFSIMKIFLYQNKIYTKIQENSV